MLDAVTLAHGAVALGIGMLVGLERERKKDQRADLQAAGLRTFAITALLGYVSMLLGGATSVAVVAFGIVLMLSLSLPGRSENAADITSGVALLLVLMLGALSLKEPELATAVGVVLTVLLALRQELHRFVLHQLSEDEVRNGLMLLTVALVVLPLTPDRFVGPYGVLNPRTICTLVVLLMAVGALGHIAMRMMGPRYGLPLSAIASGFASGSATIALLAHRARSEGQALRTLAAAAVLSNLASVIQFGLVLGIVDPRLLQPFWLPIGLGLLVTVVYGVLLLAPWRPTPAGSTVRPAARVFSLWTALAITFALTCVALLSAFLLRLLGHNGVSAAAFVTGLGDAHAATASVASLVAAGQLSNDELIVPAMMALAGNTLTKCVLAFSGGGWRFARLLAPGQLMIIGAMWAGLA